MATSLSTSKDLAAFTAELQKYLQKKLSPRKIKRSIRKVLRFKKGSAEDVRPYLNNFLIQLFSELKAY